MKIHQIIKLIRLLATLYTGRSIGLAEAIETLDKLITDGYIVKSGNTYEVNITEGKIERDNDAG